MTVLRIFLSYEATDEAFATQLMSDLREAGAEVVTASAGLDDAGFEQFLSEELPLCQQLIVVQTPEALQSPRMQAITETALKYVQQGQLTEVLRVIAPTSGTVEEQAVPLMWATTPEFDASQDYPRALAKLLWHLGLMEISDIPDAPPPASHNPELVTQDLKESEEKASASDTFHSQHTSSLDRPVRPLRKSYGSLRSPFILFPIAILLILGVAGAAIFIPQSSTPARSDPTTHLTTIQTATPTTHTKTQTSPTHAPTPTPTVAQASPTQVPAPTATPTSPKQPPAPTPTASTGNSAPTSRASGSYTKWWATTFGSAPGYIGSQQVGTLYGATNYMFCKTWAGIVADSKGNYNHWWLWTDLDTGGQGWVSAYYLSKWGNDEAKDNNGTVIPNC